MVLEAALVNGTSVKSVAHRSYCTAILSVRDTIATFSKTLWNKRVLQEQRKDANLARSS